MKLMTIGVYGFAEAYRAERLAQFDAAAFLRDLGDAQGVCLFCVERDPEACHRSLVAQELEQTLGVSVQHLLPSELADGPHRRARLRADRPG